MSKIGMSLCVRLMDEPSLAVVSEIGLTAEMFQSSDRKLFETITGHFRKFGKMPAWSTVREIVDIDPDHVPEAPEPTAYYAEQLLKTAAIKSQREHMKKLVKALDTRDPDLVVTSAKELLMESTEKYRLGSGSLTNLSHTNASRWAAYEELKALDGAITGIPSPWDVVDEQTLGWNPGDVITVCARSGQGKTWLGLQCAEHANSLGHSVGFVSPEMPRRQIEQRRDAIRYKLPYHEFKRGLLDNEAEDRYRVGLEQDTSKDANWFLAADGRCRTLADVELFAEETGVKFLLVDSVYLLQDDKAKSDYDRVTGAVRGLKSLAVRRKIPVMVLTQLKRVGKAGAAGPAGGEDIAFSGALEQDSTIVWMLFQDADRRQRKEMHHKFTKVREGQPVEFVSAWDFGAMEFGALEGETGGVTADPLADAPAKADKPKKKKKKPEEEEIPF